MSTTRKTCFASKHSPASTLNLHLEAYVRFFHRNALTTKHKFPTRHEYISPAWFHGAWIQLHHRLWIFTWKLMFGFSIRMYWKQSINFQLGMNTDRNLLRCYRYDHTSLLHDFNGAPCSKGLCTYKKRVPKVCVHAYFFFSNLSLWRLVRSLCMHMTVQGTRVPKMSSVYSELELGSTHGVQRSSLLGLTHGRTYTLVVSTSESWCDLSMQMYKGY